MVKKSGVKNQGKKKSKSWKSGVEKKNDIKKISDKKKKVKNCC